MPQLSLAIIEPEIAGNVGAMLRTSACFGVAVHIIEPCGFAFSDSALRRAGMDYAAGMAIQRHVDRTAFLESVTHSGQRLILLSTVGETDIYAMRFEPGDIIAVGSEGSGAPAAVHAGATVRVRIPISDGMRSLNVSVAAAIALAEARRQIMTRDSGEHDQ